MELEGLKMRAVASIRPSYQEVYADEYSVGLRGPRKTLSTLFL